MDVSRVPPVQIAPSTSVKKLSRQESTPNAANPAANSELRVITPQGKLSPPSPLFVAAEPPPRVAPSEPAPDASGSAGSNRFPVPSGAKPILKTDTAEQELTRAALLNPTLAPLPSRNGAASAISSPVANSELRVVTPPGKLSPPAPIFTVAPTPRVAVPVPAPAAVEPRGSITAQEPRESKPAPTTEAGRGESTQIALTTPTPAPPGRESAAAANADRSAVTEQKALAIPSKVVAPAAPGDERVTASCAPHLGCHEFTRLDHHPSAEGGQACTDHRGGPRRFHADCNGDPHAIAGGNS